MYETSRQARDSFLEEIGAGFFGEYLISQGLIDRNQLGEGLAAQRALVSHLKIGELLVKRGVLTSSALVQALTEYRAGIRIGEILIHQGDIGFIQLLEALDYQQVHRCQLGEALVALNFCSPLQIEEVLSLQKSLATGPKETGPLV